MADLVDLALIDDDEAVLDALLHYLTRQNVRTSINGQAPVPP